MDEKEKNCTCGNPDCGAEDIPMPDGDVLIISVAEYKHLIRCEASVDLLYKVLKTYGEYSPECGKMMAIACGLCGKKEGPFDA